MKNILFVLLLFSFGVLNTTAQNSFVKQVLSRENGRLCIVDEYGKHDVNKKILTAQLKSPFQTIPDSICVSHKSNSHFIDIVVPDGVDVTDYAEQLKATGEFLTVEFRASGGFTLFPNDAFYGSQWHLDTVNLPQAWDITTGAPEVKVAIVDTGADMDHPDLGNGSDGYSNVDNSLGYNYIHNTSYYKPQTAHGTIMGGIVGAKTNNGVGITGVCGGNFSRGATVVPYCIADTENLADPSYIDDAIIDAVNKGARVINLSLHTPETSDLNYAIDYAYNHGCIIVAATGNSGLSSIYYPASHENTIAVGASDKNSSRANFSCYGAGLDFVAPGVSILSTKLAKPGESLYGWATGTSASTAIVSGTVALMLSVNPCLTNSQVRDILRQTCVKLNGYSYDDEEWNQEVGYGIIDIEAAVKAARLDIAGSTIPCGQEEYSVLNLPEGYSVKWSWDNPSSTSPLITPLLSSYKCIVTNNNNAYIKDSLVAEIYSDSTLVATVKKEIDTGVNFTGTYSQNSNTLNGIYYPAIEPLPFKSGDTFSLKMKGGAIVIESDMLNDAIISTTTSVPLKSVTNENGVLTITMKQSNSGSPLFPLGYGTPITPDPIDPIPVLNCIIVTGHYSDGCEKFRFWIKLDLTDSTSSTEGQTEYVDLQIGNRKYTKILNGK